MEYNTVREGVLSANLCAYCGACIAVCPWEAITSDDDDPLFFEEKCTECKLCTLVCPILNPVSEGLSPMEKHTGRTTVEEVAPVAQDGGVVTALLIAALRNGLIGGAVVCQLSTEKTIFPEPLIAATADEAIAAAGSKYSSCPSLSLLNAAEGFESVALVGLPCQIRAFHWLKRRVPKFARPVKATIGLFCMENYAYTVFRDKVLTEAFGVRPESVIKAGIKGGKFTIRLSDGQARELPVKELKKHIRQSCRICDDLTAELADVSVGSIGSKSGWSTVYVRTEVGKELWDNVLALGLVEAKELPEESEASIIKLASSKRKKARKRRLAKEAQ